MSGSPLIDGASTEVLGAITTPELDLSQGITSRKIAYKIAEDRRHHHHMSCSTNVRSNNNINCRHDIGVTNGPDAMARRKGMTNGHDAFMGLTDEGV